MLKTHEEEKKKGENTDKKASSSKLSDVFAHKQEEGNKVDNDVDKLNSLDTDTQETQKTEISNISGKIDLAKYIKDGLHIENGNKVRIYYKAITSEGYVFTYDLFNGTVDVNSEDGWKAGIAPYKIYYEVRDLNDYPLRLK